MTNKKAKGNLPNSGISSEYLEVLKRKCLIESTGASMRLSERKVTDEQVEDILEKLEK